MGWGWGYVGGRSFIFAAGRGFSPATGSGPDSKWSTEPWGRRGVGPTLGKMTLLSLSSSEARQRRAAQLKPGFLPCTPWSRHFYACPWIPPKG